jgi:hypothetical protein
MTNFDADQHPRAAAGTFSDKLQSAPEFALVHRGVDALTHELNVGWSVDHGYVDGPWSPLPIADVAWRANTDSKRNAEALMNYTSEISQGIRDAGYTDGISIAIDATLTPISILIEPSQWKQAFRPFVIARENRLDLAKVPPAYVTPMTSWSNPVRYRLRRLFGRK